MKRSAIRPLVLALGVYAGAAHLPGAALTGRVLDSDGNPVAGARVALAAYRSEEETLSDETAGVRPAVLGATTTGADGRFSIAPRPGSPPLALRVEPSALPGAMLSGPLDSDTGALPDIVLAPAARVAGQIVAASGTAIEGARVTIFARGDPASTEAVSFAEAVSGAGGAFLAANAPAGGRVLRVRAAGFVPVARVSAASEVRERIEMKTGGGLRGTVVDASGRGAAGAIVSTSDSAVRADAAGRYRLAGVPAGNLTVEAFLGDDLIARRGPVMVQRGAETELNLTLARAASIEGSVIDQGTRRAIAGARVSVVGAGSSFRSLPLRVTRTDSRGAFRARGLPASRYTVQAARSGYLPTALSGVAAGVASPGSAKLALEPAAAVAGRVADEKGQPIRGARVRLAPAAGGNGRFRRAGQTASFLAEREVLTGPDGAFLLEGLFPVRAATIEALHGGFAPAQLPGVALKGGQTLRHVELVLRAGRTAHGSVVDEAGHGIVGAQIRLAPSEGRRARFAFRPGAAAAKPDAESGADGNFLVAGLGEGEYQATVTHDGFASRMVPALRVGGKDPVTWPAIALAKGVGIAGTVRDEQSLPIVAATVQVFGQPGQSESVQTDAAGHFRIGDLAAGRAAMIQVSAEGYTPAQQSATPPSDNLAIVLGKSATIRGRVEDAAAGSPVTDFTISRAPGSGGRGFGGQGGFRGAVPGPIAIHSDDGTFELQGVPAGTWTVSAAAAGYRRADVSGIAVTEGGTKEGVVLSLKRGTALAGRVIDAGMGNPIANATVGWQPSGSGSRAAAPGFAAIGGQSATTDADGRFTLDSLPDGKITITASQPDFLSTSRDVDPSSTTDLVLALGIGGEISGVVIGTGSGAPVVGADVRLSAQGDSGAAAGPQATQSGASGAFRFDHLAPGRYQVSAQSKAGTSAPQDLVLAENQQMDGVQVAVAGGVLVDGSVSGLPDGQQGGVSVTASADGYRAAATTGSDGKFTLNDVPSGIVRFSASTSFRQGRTSATTVEIPDDATEMPVDIAFEGLSRLAGQVTRNGKAVASVSVTASPDPPDGSGQRSSALTDGEGKYALEGLDDGDYQVSLAGQGTSYRKSIAVSGDTNGDIALPATSVSGTVTDAASGAPIEGAAIQIETGQETQAGAVKRGQADSNGFYTVADLDPGNYQVTARAAGYQLKTRSLSVDDGSAQADFALDKGAGLTIQVADGLTGMSLGGVNALVFGADGSLAFSGSVSLDATGTGEIPSLQPGQYSVHLFSAGYAPQSLASATVPSNPVALTMTPGGRVEVRASVAVAGVLFDGSGAVVLLSPFRLDGAVSLAVPVTAWEHLAPGSYNLAVGSGDGAKSYPFTVAEARTTELSLP